MSRRPARCTKADIRRAIEAAKAADVKMVIEILPDGTIRLVEAEAEIVDTAAPDASPRKPLVF